MFCLRLLFSNLGAVLSSTPGRPGSDNEMVAREYWKEY